MSKAENALKADVQTASTTANSEASKSNRKPVDLPSLEDLLKVGAHFGHKTSRWNPKMKPYIFGEKNGVHIIDIVKTTELLGEALEQIQESSDKGSILIVGTKGQAATITEQIAKDTGAFYVNNRWPGGLFTNFKMIKRSVDNLIKMEEQLASGAEGLVKKEALLLGRDVMRLNKLYEGIKFMERTPSLMIVIDSKMEKNAIKEARLMKVPIVALVDTNCDPMLVDYPVPANDDSIKSINLFMELFGKAIAGGKRADAVVALRNSHSAKVATLKADYEAAVEQKRAMEEAERERIKALRSGGTPSTEKKSQVVRVAADSAEDKEIASLDLTDRVKGLLADAGYKNVSEIKNLSKTELTSIKGIGEKAADDILRAVRK